MKKMMDIEGIEFRSAVLDAIRSFFKEKKFLELDTPSLSPVAIPESAIELFKTDYICKFGNKHTSLFLLPSPELYIKQIIAEHKRSAFQISKCYRNCESTSLLHSPEFTMLEYYSVDKNYVDSITLTQELLSFILSFLGNSPLLSFESGKIIKKGFLIKTVDELFIEHAHFSLAKEHSKEALAFHAKRLQPHLSCNFEQMTVSELYDMIFVHAIEANLPKDRLVIVKDYPYFSSTLAEERRVEDNWAIKERWELYGANIELCNCYTEERNKKKIEEYFIKEDALKQKMCVPHPSIKNFEKICEKMPPCSGVALGFDRLLMFLANKKSIDSVIPFQLNV